MLVQVVIPGTPLLIPGLGGSADPLRAERDRVLGELERALSPAAGGVERVEVRVGGTYAADGARPVPDLGSVGVDVRWSTWSFTGNDAEAAGRRDTRRGVRASVAATVALLALGGAGWTRPVDVVPADDAGTGDGRAATVVVSRADEPC